MTRVTLVLVIAGLLLIGGLMLQPTAETAYAQAPTPTDDEVNRIARFLYCPVCENTPLDVCPTEACRQWRDVIREKLTEGWSEQRIQEYFVTQYGARVLAEPPRTGLNWLIYILPPLLILAGAILLWRSLRAWKRLTAERVGEKGSSGGTSPPEDEYVQRLEEELKKLG